jgi:hypothetical protein
VLTAVASRLSCELCRVLVCCNRSAVRFFWKTGVDTITHGIPPAVAIRRDCPVHLMRTHSGERVSRASLEQEGLAVFFCVCEDLRRELIALREVSGRIGPSEGRLEHVPIAHRLWDAGVVVAVEVGTRDGRDIVNRRDGRVRLASGDLIDTLCPEDAAELILHDEPQLAQNEPHGHVLQHPRTTRNAGVQAHDWVRRTVCAQLGGLCSRPQDTAQV